MMSHANRVKYGKLGAKKRWDKEPPKSIRFWKNVAVCGANSCWVWIRGKTNKGYGKATHKNKCTSSHRVAWELSHGPIPKGMCICHHCDNPPCCNPSHLFLGTYSDNARDCINKGKWGKRTWPKSVEHLKGEDSPNSKLTNKQVKTIRVMAKIGDKTQAEIGKMFGVGQDQISRIINRKRWSHL